MVKLPSFKSDKKEICTPLMGTHNLLAQITPEDLKIKKSSVIYDNFSYNTSFENKNLDESELGLTISTATTLEQSKSSENTVDIWLNFQGKFLSSTSVLNFGLRQKLRVNRNWKTPEDIDPVLKQAMYRDIYASFIKVFNSMEPNSTLECTLTKNGIEVRGKLA